jgi:carnitine 3-dehydrogenase
VKGLEPIAVTTQVISADAKRLHLFHRMTHERDGALVATAEHMLLHVDATSRGVGPMREPVAGRVAAIAAAQAHLERPEGAGRRVGERP